MVLGAARISSPHLSSRVSKCHLYGQISHNPHGHCSHSWYNSKHAALNDSRLANVVNSSETFSRNCSVSIGMATFVVHSPWQRSTLPLKFMRALGVELQAKVEFEFKFMESK